MKQPGRNILMRVVALGAALGCSNAAGTGTTKAPTQAIVTFAFDGHPQDTIRVLFHDSTAIAQAINYIAKQQGPKFPIGPIRRGAGVDQRYPFHFDPDSVQLAEAAIELCDGPLMRTTAELNAFIKGSTGDENAPRAIWCPWSARPIKVDEHVVE